MADTKLEKYKRKAFKINARIRFKKTCKIN